MPKVSPEQATRLGPLILPFERSHSKNIEEHIFEGEREKFEEHIHNGENNNKPKQYCEITREELEQENILGMGSYRSKCFLWVIDEESIKILYEDTTNTLRSSIDKPYVCHTNITGCNQAYIGGEMYFCEDGNVYVNFKSDRYGRPDTEDKKQAAIEYIKCVGYKNVILIDL